MTALAAERATLALENGLIIQDYPVLTATTIYKGSIVAVNAAGYAVPGSVATTQIAIGRCSETVVNSGASGAKKVKVEAGVFKYDNSAAADAIAQAEVGDFCYIVDDQTVAKTSGTSTRSRAGRIVGVDAGGVWVAIGNCVQPSDSVTLAGTETLTNKILNGPSAAITFSANAATILISGGNYRQVGTMAANSTLTIGTTGAVAGACIRIARDTLTAHTVAIVNGGAGAGTLFTMSASKKAVVDVCFDGTNWVLGPSYQEG
jgi:hypothetical protein